MLDRDRAGRAGPTAIPWRAMSESERPPLPFSAEAVHRARAPLARAFTLPAEAFTSAEVYAREESHLFAGGWLCVARLDQVPEPGDYLSIDLLAEPLLVVRGDDDRVRVLSRVCRHRAAELVSDSGNTRSFQCPYHAWTYRLNGELLGAPLMDGAEDFDKRACSLPEIRSETWQGWLFVNLDGKAAPLGPRLAPLSAALSHFPMEDCVAVETARFDSPFNWKVLVDNFMEAYHHIAIHRDTLEPMLPAAASHTPENAGPYSLLHMPDVEGNDPARTAAGGLTAAVVFPFHLFAPTAHALTWYQFLPERHDRFALRIYTCFPRAVLEDPAGRDTIESLHALTRTIHTQDIAACEATWRGLRSDAFEQGRLSPLEKPIWQFNQWWLDCMA